MANDERHGDARPSPSWRVTKMNRLATAYRRHYFVEGAPAIGGPTVIDISKGGVFERGFAGVSVDEIARRSGVAKTTIYRHWPTRGDLLRDACLRIGTPLEVPDTGSFKEDVSALLTSLAHLLRSAKWPSVVPSVIDAAERDPNVAAVYSRLQEGCSAPLQLIIQRGMKSGDLLR